MAIFEFGVNRQQILQRLPIATSEISDDTLLSFDDIDEFIVDRASMLEGLLTSQGLGEGDELDEVTLRQARMYIHASVVADCLDKFGGSTVPGYDRYRTEAEKIYQQFIGRPQTLYKRVSRVRSNATTTPLVRDFTGRNYEF